MNHHTVLLGTLMAAGTGLVAGWAIGDLMRRYWQGVEQLDTLRRQLPQPYSAVSGAPAPGDARRAQRCPQDAPRVTKSPRKTPLVNHTKSMAGSHRSGRSLRCGL
jgi:hypothetical protein